VAVADTAAAVSASANTAFFNVTIHKKIVGKRVEQFFVSAYLLVVCAAA